MAQEQFYYHERIVVDPEIPVRNPLVKGTRIPVELVLKRWSLGPDLDLLIEAHPRLTPEDLKECQAYAKSWAAL